MGMKNQFHGSASRSLNALFMVKIPEKGGAKDITDFRLVILLAHAFKFLQKSLKNG